MHEFLPEIYARIVAKEYRTRLFFVSFSLAIVALAIALALSLPSYFLLRAKAEAANTIASAQPAGAEIEGTAKRIEEQRSVIASLAGQERMAAAIERLVSRQTAGIRISGLSLRRGVGSAALSLSGIAATRENLVFFVKSLEGDPTFTNVNLPVSALAKARDISFSLSIDHSF